MQRSNGRKQERMAKSKRQKQHRNCFDFSFGSFAGIRLLLFFIAYFIFFTLVFSALNFCMHVSALTLKFFLLLCRLCFYLFFLFFCALLLFFITFYSKFMHTHVFLLLYYVAEEEAIFTKQRAIIIKTIKRRQK